MEFKKILPPGTIFNTSKKETKTIINKIFYNKDFIGQEAKDDNYQLWVRVNGFTDTNLIVNELNKLSIDNLIIEDIFNLNQRAKIEEIENGFFAIIKTTSYVDKQFIHGYISVLLKDNTVFTFNENPPKMLDVIEERLANSDSEARKREAKYLFYLIIDALIDTNIIFEHEISGLINFWEERIVVEKTNNIDELHKIRKEVLSMKTNVFSLVESIDLIDGLLKKKPVNGIVKYYKDLLDHLYRLDDKMKLDWEEIKSLYEIHMNNISDRTNSIMKTLTIFSAIFIPLSFLAGVFGMNFIKFDVLENPNGLFIFIGICVMITLLMIGFFKYKRWF